MAKRRHHRRRRSFRGTDAQHRTAAGLQAKELRRELQYFRQVLKAKNCDQALISLLLANRNGARYLDNAYYARTKWQTPRGTAKALASAKSAFEKVCLKRTRR